MDYDILSESKELEMTIWWIGFLPGKICAKLALSYSFAWL